MTSFLDGIERAQDGLENFPGGRFERDGLEALLSNDMRAVTSNADEDDILSWLAR